MPEKKKLLADIEGTAGDIAFVREVLFPYFLENFSTWLKRVWNTEEGQKTLASFRKQAAIDREKGMNKIHEIPPAPVEEELIFNVVRMITENANEYVKMDLAGERKTLCLKEVQGEVWRAGYVTGKLKAHLYPDTLDLFDFCHREEITIGIFSSGSVAAQRLYFQYSCLGDLSQKIGHWFDTTVFTSVDKPKNYPQSYRTIAASMGTIAENVIYATDIYEEAIAAFEAGMTAVIVQRPGNKATPINPNFLYIKDLKELQPLLIS